MGGPAPVDEDATRRGHASAEALLARHGVVTRGAVVAERLPGGFAGAYRVLSAFEESGRTRRGYFVAGLGAAQFGTTGAVDRLRTFGEPAGGVDGAAGEPSTYVLAATDPANPYGAALPWPDRPGTVGRDGDEPTATEAPAGTHRPGRKAGALVVVVDGELVLYVERGGRTLLTFTAEADPSLARPTRWREPCTGERSAG
ncbi:Lhr family helicase [Nocardioides zeae]